MTGMNARSIRCGVVISELVGLSLLGLIAVPSSFVVQVLFLLLAIGYLLRKICRLEFVRQFQNTILILLIIAYFLPVDLAIRRGEKFAIYWGNVFVDVSPQRMKREHPAQRWVIYNGYCLLVPPRLALIIIIPTKHEIGTPLFRDPHARLLVGPRW